MTAADSGPAPVSAALHLLEMALNYRGGYVEPTALTGWVFTTGPRGTPIAICLCPKIKSLTT